MKVLHITSPKTWRGGEQQLIYLAEEQKAKGVELIILCPFNSAVHRYCLNHHLQHITYYKGFSANPMVAFRVNHLCKREGIDLIHVHDSHAHNFAILAAVLTSNDVPIIVSRRVDFPVNDTSFSTYKYNHPHIARIVCVSDAIRQIMLPSIERSERVVVVYSGIDLSRFESVGKQNVLREEFNIPEDKTIIANVAALAPHKDYPTFIATAKKLMDEGLSAHFFAIGDGPSRKDVEREILAAEMEEHITLLGFRSDVEQLLASIDLFLITSKTEGLGTSILDALASGAPVVATAAGGITEIIEHEKTGLLAEVNDAEGLAKQVKVMLGNEALRKQCVAQGYDKVKDFSKEEMAAKTLEIYEMVLSEDPESRKA